MQVRENESSTTATCHVLESLEYASAAKGLGILAVLATLAQAEKTKLPHGWKDTCKCGG